MVSTICFEDIQSVKVNQQRSGEVTLEVQRKVPRPGNTLKVTWKRKCQEAQIKLDIKCSVKVLVLVSTYCFLNRDDIANQHHVSPPVTPTVHYNINKREPVGSPLDQ